MGDNILNLDELDIGGKPPFEFVFDGETYRCATPEALDVRDLKDLAAEADADPLALLTWLLGPEQIETLDKAPAVFALPHVQAVIEGWYEHHGLTPGKSGGSSTSPGTRKHRRR